MKETFPIMGKTYKGLEEVLAKELKNLGAEEIEVGNRAVSFVGNMEMLYKANLWSRTATRFLVPIVTFEAKDAEELYEKAKMIDWTEFLTSDKTFTIDSTVYSETFTHSKYATYRIKDAIADQFTEKEGKRPSVSLTSPDIMINLHIADTTCTISIDSTGESLHKRGYRVAQTEAPISEVLAAGMLLTAGWNGETDFIDPMCGSGTILIEAALIALNIPPGIFRKEFAFERWSDFDNDLFDQMYNDESQEREFTHKIYGSDISKAAIRIAEQNIKSAGVQKYIELQNVAFQELELTGDKMLMVTNPPYGQRLHPERILDLYGDFGRMLKQKFTGNDACVISNDDTNLGSIGMKPSKKIQMMNGDIDCLYCQYEVFSGTRKDFVLDKIEKGEYHKEEKKEEFEKTERGHFKFEKDIRKFDDRKGKFSREKREHRGKRFYSDKKGDTNYGEKSEYKDRKPFKRERQSEDRKPFGRRNDRSYGSKDDRNDKRPFRKRWDNDENKKEHGDRKFGSKKPFRGKDDIGGRKFDDRKSLRNGGRRKSDNDIED